MNMKPLVSVIIPTRNRPDTLLRAIRSIQAQTLKNIEIIVVIDGPDEQTNLELAKLNDCHLKTIALPESVGGSGARNAGINHSTADWIAFLDDDDEWLPTKLEIQMRLAQASAFTSPIIGCRVLVRTPIGEFVLPRRLPLPNEHISEYMMSRKSAFHGEGLLQTSMLLMKRELLNKIQFTDNLLRHQETDLLLRAFTCDGVGLEMAEETLSIWYKDDTRARVSRTGDWKYSLNWLNSVQNYITARAYASFLLTGVSPIAAQEKAWSAFPVILKEAIQNGQPTFMDYLILLAMWGIPRKFRVILRTLILRIKT